MKRILFGLGFLFVIGCQNKPDLKRLYSYHYQQDSSFDESDINEMLNSEYNTIDESQLNDSIKWTKMKLVDSIFLKENACQIYAYRYKSEKSEDYLCYTTKDAVKLVVYASVKIDTDLIYVLKDQKFKKVITELIKNDRFVFNQLNEKIPPELMERFFEEATKG